MGCAVRFAEVLPLYHDVPVAGGLAARFGGNSLKPLFPTSLHLPTTQPAQLRYLPGVRRRRAALSQSLTRLRPCSILRIPGTGS
jgi:hypothetical protein